MTVSLVVAIILVALALAIISRGLRIVPQQHAWVAERAAVNWGVKVLRYEIRDISPPDEVIRAMELQITAERQKRALIAKSEGETQQAINVSEGERQQQINRAEGEKQAQVLRAEGEAQAVMTVAAATAKALSTVGASGSAAR